MDLNPLKKSTSDESYTLELEEQSLIASATNKIEKMAAAAAAQIENGDLLYSTSNSIYRLSSGEFGFNPISVGLLSSRTRSGRVNGFPRAASNSTSAGSRKTVKRLSGQSKFFIDSLKKSNQTDCNFCQFLLTSPF